MGISNINNTARDRISEEKKQFFQNMDNSLGNSTGGADDGDDNGANAVKHGGGKPGKAAKAGAHHVVGGMSAKGTPQHAELVSTQPSPTSLSAHGDTAANLSSSATNDVHNFIKSMPSDAQTTYNNAAAKLQSDLQDPNVSSQQIDSDVNAVNQAATAMGAPNKAIEAIDNAVNNAPSLSNDSGAEVMLAAAKAGIDMTKSDDSARINAAKAAAAVASQKLTARETNEAQAHAAQANNTYAGNQGGSSSGASYASNGSNAPKASAAINGGADQSGNGAWNGDLNNAATSTTYQGLSVDQLAASNSGIGQALQQHPDILAAIKQVSASTGVPSGLLAGVVYQESGFNVNATSGNPDDGQSDLGLCQAGQNMFSAGQSWQNPVDNLTVCAQALASSYSQGSPNSWGSALRDWNSGAHNSNNLSDTSMAAGTDPNYIHEILGTHCLGQD